MRISGRLLPLLFLVPPLAILIWFGSSAGGSAGGMAAAVTAVLGVLLFLQLQWDERGRRVAERIAPALLALLPGLLIVYLGFEDGGFFPDGYGFAAFALCVLLAIRTALLRDPFAGFSKPLAVAAAALALYAIWTALSITWSDAPGRGVLEANRVLLYLVAVVLFGSAAREVARAQWMVRGLVLAFFVLAMAGLATRVLPEAFPVTANLANNRLSFPLNYWNALGLLAGLGTIFSLHLTSSLREPPPLRAAAAAALPLLAACLLFTFSRGAIAVTAFGLVAYALLARPRALPSALLAAAPATAVALVLVYNADLLATARPTTAAAVEQGEGLAPALLLCAMAAGAIRALMTGADRRLRQRSLGERVPRRVAVSARAATALGAVVLFLALGGPGALTDYYEGFTETNSSVGAKDLRDRLTDPSNNHRVEGWSVALKGFQDAPLRGRGAGTYRTLWDAERPLLFTIADAHSLYVENLAELGVVGLALVIIAVLTLLGGFAGRLRGPNRTVYGALCAAGLAWAVHAALDWDWEMPAVSLWLFAAGGAALARRRERNAEASPRPRLSHAVRGLIVVGVSAVSVLPGLLVVSESRRNVAVQAFRSNDCEAALAHARASLDALPMRAEPHEIISYCALRAPRPQHAIGAMGEAIAQDPENWEYHYGLALVRARAGLDPRGAARRAAQLNPRDPVPRRAARILATRNAEQWRTRSRRLMSGRELVR